MGDGCLISLEHTWNADIVLLFDSSNALNGEEFGWLTFDLSQAVLQTFPQIDARYAFVP